PTGPIRGQTLSALLRQTEAPHPRRQAYLRSPFPPRAFERPLLPEPCLGKILLRRAQTGNHWPARVLLYHWIPCRRLRLDQRIPHNRNRNRVQSQSPRRGRSTQCLPRVLRPREASHLLAPQSLIAVLGFPQQYVTIADHKNCPIPPQA